MPYAFLDDAPLEERRTQAVVRAQRGIGGVSGDTSDSELDPAVLQQVQQECWPDPVPLYSIIPCGVVLIFCSFGIQYSFVRVR